MMKLLIKWCAVISIACLSGCAHLDKIATSAWLKPGVQVVLPAPGISPEIHEQQLLTATFQKKQQSLVVMLDADSSHIALIGLSSLGIKLFQVMYDQQGIHTQQFIVLPQLPKANQVLADIMLSYWAVSDWEKVLPHAWRIREEDLLREVLDDKGHVVISILYAQTAQGRQPVALNHHIFNYQIQIQRLD